RGQTTTRHHRRASPATVVKGRRKC
ncbi:hypothetical protein Goarm_008408, partial [Gossypium armourianum]|nr:hypothetical protein [Gossypium armourianum]